MYNGRETDRRSEKRKEPEPCSVELFSGLVAAVSPSEGNGAP